MIVARRACLAAVIVSLSAICADAAPPQRAPRPVAALRAEDATRPEPARSGSMQNDPGAVDLPAIREHLLTQLKRAADAGYVVLREPSRAGAASPAVGETVSATPPSAGESAGEAVARQATARRMPRRERLRAAPDGAPPLLARARADARNPAGPLASARGRPTPPCIEDELLSLEPSPEAALPPGGARPALVGEFDHPLAAAVLAASRHHLRRGLQAEARLVLDSFGAAGPEARALRLMAAVLDRRPGASGQAFPARNCGPRYRLWQAVEAAGSGSFEPGLMTDAGVRDALLAQPRAVRGLMAVRLGRAAISRGEAETAHRLHDIALRDRGQIDPAWFALFTAELAHEDGESDAALKLLREMRDAPGAPGARALLLMARIALERPDSVARGTLRLRLDLGAAARAWRGSALGDELLIAEARLVAAGAGVAEAVSLLRHGASVGLIRVAALDRAVASLASMPTRARGGPPLAVLYHARPETFRGALQDPSFRAALARSYASVGTPRLAVPLLTASDLADVELVAELTRSAVELGDRETVRALQGGPAAEPDVPTASQPPASAPGAVEARLPGPGRRAGAMTDEAGAGLRRGPPSLEAAAAAALQALEEGRADIPPRALAVLKRRKPRLAAVLTSPSAASGPDGPDSRAYLRRLDQELSAIGDLLHDG